MAPPLNHPERRSGASTEALANSDRLARLIRIVAVLLAVYVAFAVTVASVIGVANSLSANRHAAEAERLAREARDQAKTNGGIATNVENLVAQQAPCEEGDPPDSPGCLRQARSDKMVGEAIANIQRAFAASLDTHDLNAAAAHDRLLRERGRTPVTRVPITSPPQTTVRATTTSAAPSVVPPLLVHPCLPPQTGD